MAEEVNAATQRHVLVVDDDAELAAAYRELLEAFGYRVTTAPNGAAGLKFVLESEVDAVLSDLSMPVMDGVEFFEAVRRERPRLGRRFIFMTGHMNNPKYEAILKSGCAKTLYKPVAINILLEALKAVFAEATGK